jgi:hypothetical protein
VKSAAETFRQNPKLDVETAISNWPSVKRWFLCWMRPELRRRRTRFHLSAAQPASATRRFRAAAIIQSSLVYGTYEKGDRPGERAEMLAARATQTAPASVQPSGVPQSPQPAAPRAERSLHSHGLDRAARWPSSRTRGENGEQRRPSIGSGLGREIIRGVLGSIFGGKRR